MENFVLLLTFFLLGLTALIFGIWTVLGLLFGSRGKDRKAGKRWFLGVCADFSHLVGIPLGLVRMLTLIYAPFLIGLLFYVLYYYVLGLREKNQPKPQPRLAKPQITRMDSLHIP